MAFAIIPIVFVIIGLLMLAFAANPKLTIVGYIVFGAAFLVTMEVAAKVMLHLP